MARTSLFHFVSAFLIDVLTPFFLNSYPLIDLIFTKLGKDQLFSRFHRRGWQASQHG